MFHALKCAKKRFLFAQVVGTFYGSVIQDKKLHFTVTTLLQQRRGCGELSWNLKRSALCKLESKYNLK